MPRAWLYIFKDMFPISSPGLFSFSRLAEFFYDVKKKQSPALVPLASKGQKT